MACLQQCSDLLANCFHLFLRLALLDHRVQGDEFALLLRCKVGLDNVEVVSICFLLNEHIIREDGTLPEQPIQCLESRQQCYLKFLFADEH